MSSLPMIENRVDRLEDSIDRFITSVGIEFNKLYNSQMRTEAELRTLRDQMSVYKEENRRQIKEMNKQWGELSNKLGTMVEDLVYPSMTHIIQDVLGLETDRIWVRLKQRLADGRVKEFDAVGDEIMEVKNRDGFEARRW